ncbi:DUF6588 family protein [Zhouia sp. PK063]|uniref:DUF6588 family protein n=1 Tax=Zhouia sp. PK063 TaxID=3373602 RepID=UPI0037906FA8
MKKISTLLFCLVAFSSFAQQNLNDLLAAGASDAKRFAADYFAPGNEAAMYSISNGWFNSAETRGILGFEISVIGNITLTKSEDRAFLMNASDYENISFTDGSSSKNVATILGDIEGVKVNIGDGLATTTVELPTGLASIGVKFVPSGYLQASLGIFKGTEIKARFFPKVDVDDVNVGFYGVGLQHEFTKWLPGSSLWPVAISGLVAYTHLNGDYDFTASSAVNGDNQRFNATMNTWVFQAIASTKLPIINFYGSIGFISGKATTDLLGTYMIQEGPFQSETITDPFSIKNKINGVRTTVGAKLKLGFFRLNADYTLADYQNVTVGLSFGFR